MNVSFLFWNINRQPLTDLIARLTHERQVDVLILAECEVEPEEVLKAVSEAGGTRFTFPFSPAKRLRVFTRFPKSWVRPVFDDPLGHVSVRRLIIEQRMDVLLAIVHVRSKLYWSDKDQVLACAKLAAGIEAQEDEFRHRRTVLVGDFNMNPFEAGVVAAGGLHAVMTRKLAADGAREVDATQYPYLYNPMWGFFGDRSEGPPGTYYYRDARPVMYFWNIFDQVLLRPALMDKLVDLKIIESIGGVSLLSQGRWPDPTVGSDHLPLFFVLDL